MSVSHAPMRGTAGYPDGFPRTLVQADGLAHLLDEIAQPVDNVVLFEIDPWSCWSAVAGGTPHVPALRPGLSCRAEPATRGRPLRRRQPARPVPEAGRDNEETVRRRPAVYRERARSHSSTTTRNQLLRRIGRRRQP